MDSTTAIGDTTKIITGLTNGTTYYYRITTVDTARNESGYSNEVSATPVDNVAPTTPTNLTAAPGNQQVTLKWNQNTENDFAKYYIYGGTSANPNTKVDSTTAIGDTTKIITGLTNGTTYYYRITTVDTARNESGYSNEVSVVPYGFDNDSLAVIALYDSLGGTNWTNKTNWKTNQPLASWYGITVEKGRVTRIVLENNQLSGQIPAAIGNLDTLNNLDLQNNLITGILPVEIGNLVKLDSLNLFNTNIGGTIPDTIVNLSELQYLDLSASFSGPIPDRIGNLSLLEKFYCVGANLTGTIPTSIGNLSQLVELRLHTNQLSGTFPSEIGNLSNLKVLFLNQNLLSGSIPSTIGNLTHLTDLYLYENRLSGAVPKEIGRLTNVKLVYMWSNELSGALPDSVVNMTNLTDLELQSNQFTDLPDLSSMNFLTTLMVENNRLTFEDFEPNVKIETFTYSPQDSVGNARDTSIQVGDPLNLTVIVGGSANVYAWEKNGIPISGADSSTFLLPSVTFPDAGSYLCKVTNSTVTGLTLYSRPVNVTVTADSAAPAPPQGLTADPGSHKITLRWNGNTELDLHKYLIYRGESSPASTLIDSVVGGGPPLMPDTVYTDTNVVNGKVYYYRLKAEDLAGIQSPYSSEISARPRFNLWFVDDNAGPDTTGKDGSQALPYGDIGDAFNNSRFSSGDTILVLPGTYNDLDDHDLTAPDFPFVLKSRDGPASTIIDLQYLTIKYRFITFSPGADTTTKVIGFTLRDGKGPVMRISAVSDVGNHQITPTNPLIRDCIFSGNQVMKGDPDNVNGVGGAVFISGSSPVFEDCQFLGNQALTKGGAVYIEGQNEFHVSNPIFRGCIFRDNQTTSDTTGFGGAVFVGNGTIEKRLIFERCEFTGNKTYSYGGALDFNDWGSQDRVINLEIINCLFARNSTYAGTGVETRGAALEALSEFLNLKMEHVTIADNITANGNAGIAFTNAYIYNSIMWGNSLENSDNRPVHGANGTVLILNSLVENGSLIQGFDQSTGLTVNPEFSNPDSNDYTLSNESPGIGSGTPQYTDPLTGTKVTIGGLDLAGNPRVQPAGTNPDLGAYESYLAVHGPIKGLVFDGVIGDTIRWSNDATQLSAFWTVFETEVGIDSFEYALGEKDGILNGIVDWTPLSGTDSTVSVIGLSLQKDHTYRFAVRAKDIYGTWSGIALSPGVTIDLDPPAVTVVKEATQPALEDLDWFGSGVDVAHTWSGNDNGELAFFEYAVGTTSGGTEVVPWTNMGLDSGGVSTGDHYSEGPVYYTSARVTDKAGNVSPVVSSDGFQIDATPPLVGIVNDGPAEDIDLSSATDSLSANWSGFSDQNQSGIEHYEMAVGTSPGTADMVAFIPVALSSVYTVRNLSLTHGVRYYCSVRAIDQLGNVSTPAVSDGFTIDAYVGPPQVTGLSPSVGSILSLLAGNLISFQFSEPIQSYAVDVAATALSPMAHHEDMSAEDQMTVTLDNYPPSHDVVSIQIKNLTDLAGVVAKDTLFTFSTALLADYDGNELVDVTDLNDFVVAWNAKDYSLELGPTVGSVPNLILQPDNQYNLRDVMAFTRMWHWSRQNNRTVARVPIEFGPALKPVQAGKKLVLTWPVGTVTGSVEFDYSGGEVKLSEIREITTERQLTLFDADSLQGSARLVFTDFNGRSVPDRQLQLRFKGHQNVELRLTYELFDKDGALLSKGTRLLKLTPIPDQFALHQNYPNPFNPITTIHYDLPIDAQVSLVVYNLLGHRVCTLENGFQTAGYKTVVWNGANGNGVRVAAGIYFYQLVTPQFTKVKKMVLLK